MKDYGQYFTKLHKNVLIHKQKKQDTKFSTKHSNKKLTTWLKNVRVQHRAKATRYLLCTYQNYTFRMYKLRTDYKLSLLLSTVLN